MRTALESYNVAEGSPVFRKWPETRGGKILSSVFHFDLKYYSYSQVFTMYQYYQTVDNSMMRHITGIPVLHTVEFDFSEFEKNLVYFIRKIRKYTRENNTPLTKDEYKQIRKFFRKKYEEFKKNDKEEN